MPSFIFEKERTPASSTSRRGPRAGLGGSRRPGWVGGGGRVGGRRPAAGSQAAPEALPARARSELLTSPRKPCKLPEGVRVCACARVRAGEGGAGGAARLAASRAAAGGRLLPRGLRSARPNLASRQLARRRPAAHLERGAGVRPRPFARPPAAHKAEPREKERPERDAPPAPRPRRPARRPPAPCISPARQLTSAKGAAAAPGESEANFGAGSPARSSVPGSLPGSRSPGRATPPLPSTVPAPGPAGRTGLLPAAPGKGGRGGGVSLHGLSPDAAAPGPGPAARTGPQGGSESAKCLVGARGGRRGRGGGCRGSARLGRRGAARAMLRMFGMRTGMK